MGAQIDESQIRIGAIYPNPTASEVFVQIVENPTELGSSVTDIESRCMSNTYGVESLEVESACKTSNMDMGASLAHFKQHIRAAKAI